MLNQVRENWEQIYEELKQFYTLKEFIEHKGANKIEGNGISSPPEKENPCYANRGKLMG
jgi:hypothetical protein